MPLRRLFNSLQALLFLICPDSRLLRFLCSGAGGFLRDPARLLHDSFVIYRRPLPSSPPAEKERDSDQHPYDKRDPDNRG